MTDPSLKNYESLIFDSETTYKDNFRVWELKPDVKTTYKEKKLALRPCPVPLKDLHALTAWRDPNVPFDLYHRPKEIIRTDPRVIQKSYDKPPDLDREKVQKTRPKVLITPALDIDSLEEPHRQRLVDNMYTSTTAKALKDAVTLAHLEGVRAPLSEVYARCNPVALEPVKEPYVSPEWRMDSMRWDKRQLRTYTEPTKKFWLSRGLSHCPEYKATGRPTNQRRGF